MEQKILKIKRGECFAISVISINLSFRNRKKKIKKESENPRNLIRNVNKY